MGAAMTTAISVVLLILGISLCVFGAFATIKRYANPAQTDVFGSRVSVPESVAIIVLGLAAVVGSAVIPQLIPKHPADPGTETSSSPQAGPPTSPAAVGVGGSTSPAPSSPSALGPTVVITAPKNGSRVPGRAGVAVSGTADGMDSQTLWLLVQSHGVYYLGSQEPVNISDGTWIQGTGQIGAGTSDVGETFVFATVIANPSCDSALRAVKPNGEGDLALRNLPKGCMKGPSLNVVKATP